MECRHYFTPSPINRKAIWLAAWQDTILCWMALSLVPLFFASCANSSNTSATPTPRHTATIQSDQHKLPPTPSANPGPTPAEPSMTAFSTQQAQKTLQENGQTLTVPITSRMLLTFDQRQHPRQHIQFACTPLQAMDDQSVQAGDLLPPFYRIGYQADEPGVCTIKNGNFRLTVKVVALQ